MNKNGCQCNMKFKCKKTDFDGNQHPADVQVNKVEKQTDIVDLECGFVSNIISRTTPKDYSKHKFKIPPNTNSPLLI